MTVADGKLSVRGADSVTLLLAMAKTQVKRLVFSSTAAVYGNPERVPIPEDAPVTRAVLLLRFAMGCVVARPQAGR